MGENTKGLFLSSMHSHLPLSLACILYDCHILGGSLVLLSVLIKSLSLKVNPIQESSE